MLIFSIHFKCSLWCESVATFIAIGEINLYLFSVYSQQLPYIDAENQTVLTDSIDSQMNTYVDTEVLHYIYIITIFSPQYPDRLLEVRTMCLFWRVSTHLPFYDTLLRQQTIRLLQKTPHDVQLTALYHSQYLTPPPPPRPVQPFSVCPTSGVWWSCRAASPPPASVWWPRAARPAPSAPPAWPCRTCPS